MNRFSVARGAFSLAMSGFVGCTLSPMLVFAQDSAKPASPKKEIPIAVASFGTIKVDGEIDEAWNNLSAVEVKKIVKSESTLSESEAAKGTVKLLWDKENLYALWQVKDSKLSATSFDPWGQDSVELFIDELNEKAGAYQKDDAQYRVSYEGKISGDGMGYSPDNIKAAAKKVEGGYVVEMAIKLSFAKREAGAKLGLELQINDDPKTGNRGAITKWNHPENDSYMSTTDFGDLVLEMKEKAPEKAPEKK